MNRSGTLNAVQRKASTSLRRSGCILSFAILLLLTGRSTGSRSNDLSLWIDENQVATFIGMRLKIYVVKDGRVAPYLKENAFMNNLPAIPPFVDTINLTWSSGLKNFSYRFDQLKSRDERVLYDPLLSIPVSGDIPSKKTVFQIVIPCTGSRRGLVGLRLGLVINNDRGEPLRGSPIRIRPRKYCRSTLLECGIGCKNGGLCDKSGNCKCRNGYHGKHCEIVLDCGIACKNGGLCDKAGNCKCRNGYDGKSCEIAICRPGCKNNGTCVPPGQCRCPEGTEGRYCERYSLCNLKCQNGASCITKMGTGMCWCALGYYGKKCQFRLNKFEREDACAVPCGHHGVCVGKNRCRCKAQWRGKYCRRRKRGRRNYRQRKQTRNSKTRRRHRKRSRRRQERKNRRRSSANSGRKKVRRRRGRWRKTKKALGVYILQTRSRQMQPSRYSPNVLETKPPPLHG